MLFLQTYDLDEGKLYTLKFHINKITLVISIIEKKQEALKRHILLQNQ